MENQTDEKQVLYAIEILEHYRERSGNAARLEDDECRRIDQWLGQGVPVFCVMRGIDRALAGQRREAVSLNDCENAVREACTEICGSFYYD